jgi:Peptidase family M28
MAHTRIAATPIYSYTYSQSLYTPGVGGHAPVRSHPFTPSVHPTHSSVCYSASSTAHCSLFTVHSSLSAPLLLFPHARITIAALLLGPHDNTTQGHFVDNRWANLSILLFLLLISALLAGYEGVPSSVPITAPPDVFSAERAMDLLNAFATAPHPIGSAQHDRVRDYLVAQFTSLGLTPDVQKTTGVTPRYRVAGTVENIVARLKGTGGSSDAVALVAHYDSVPAGPGAGDDGAAVAAMLETLRVLKAGPPLRNDVLFVITDGEEDGLLGASAFVAENPNAKDIRVLVNFEARGNAGPSQMFETSAENGRLVQDWVQSSPHPSGSSLTYEVYKYMPNDTDMTVFKRAGDLGLNFAFIGDWEAYHTPLDNPKLLDHGSLQQHGDNALALARVFGDAGLTKLQAHDAVYFSLPGNLVPHYSSRLVWPLTFITGLFLLGVIFYANGAWQTSLLQILAGFFIHVVLLIVLCFVGLGFVLGARWLHLHVFAEGPLDQSVPYTLGLFALLFALQALVWRFFRKRVVPAAFFLGGAILTYVLVLLTSRWMPGATYEFVWPLLAALFATATVAFRRSFRPWLTALALCVLSLLALLLWIPLLQGFFQALGFTYIGAPVLSVAFGLLCILLLPYFDPMLGADGKLLPVLALAVAAIFCFSGVASTEYSPAHPKPSVLAYALDADTGKAVWASSVARLDSWTAEYLGVSPTRGKLPDFFPDWYPIEFLQHEAPAITLPPPKAELLDQSTDAGTRTLHLRISSPRHARSIHVGVSQGQVLNASVNGHDLGQPSQARWNQSGSWNFEYCNPGDGIDVLLHVQGNTPVKLVLVDRSMGLIPGAHLPPRPLDSMPIHSGDQTMVRRSFTF